jgi:hypothetical protein
MKTLKIYVKAFPCHLPLPSLAEDSFLVQKKRLNHFQGKKNRQLSKCF